jgi:hypothetical protein
MAWCGRLEWNQLPSNSRGCFRPMHVNNFTTLSLQNAQNRSALPLPAIHVSSVDPRAV